MKMYKALLLLLLFILIVSCSSAPERAEEVVEKKNSAAEYAEYGNSYYNQGMYTQSLNFFTLSLSYNGAVFNEIGMILSYNSIGKVYIALGEMEKAEASYKEAMELAIRVADVELIAQSINNLGELYLKQEKFDLSLQKFEEALKYSKDLPHDKVAIIYHNMGIVYKRKKDPETSLNFFVKALKINLGKKFHEEIASNYYMIASIYSEKEEFESALKFAKNALEEDMKVENSLGIAKDFQALGIISLKSGNEEDAYIYFKNCLFVYKSLKNIYPNFTLSGEMEAVQNYLKPLEEKYSGD